MNLPSLPENPYANLGPVSLLNWEKQMREEQLLVSLSESAALRASLAQSEAERERLKEEVEKLKSRQVHTQEWYASHYAKLEDWARKILPEPWRNQFFSCIANGTYDGMLDRGEPYMCKAGFMVTPSGYIHMDTAEGQVIRDQTTRAEDAEAELARERELIQGLRQVVKELQENVIRQNRQDADLAYIRAHGADAFLDRAERNMDLCSCDHTRGDHVTWGPLVDEQCMADGGACKCDKFAPLEPKSKPTQQGDKE